MQDFNGLGFQLSAWARWQAAAGLVPFDSAFSTAIGGYPAGATVLSATTAARIWISTAENNTTNPDANTAANWLPLMLPSDVKAAIPRNELPFATTQNWTVPTGITQAFVEMWGGGGGGGGSSGSAGIGTGGGGGEYRRGRFDVTPGQVIAITIGPGGAGGNGGVGGNGGTTSFGAFMSTSGGQGGGYGNNVASAQVTPGGSSGAGGNIEFPGVNGGFGQNGTANGVATYSSGIGGSSPLGGASPAINVNSAGGAGLSPGGGGNGGCIGNVGGNGSNGLVIIRF
jgi:hypothetical protein